MDASSGTSAAVEDEGRAQRDGTAACEKQSRSKATKISLLLSISYVEIWESKATKYIRR